MKKTIIISILALSAIACHRKTASSNENIIISNKTNVEEKPKMEVPKTETPNTDLTTAGKIIYTTRCNRCHDAKPTERFSQSEWENILKSMIPKARLNEEQGKQVTAYVMANAKK